MILYFDFIHFVTIINYLKVWHGTCFMMCTLKKEMCEFDPIFFFLSWRKDFKCTLHTTVTFTVCSSSSLSIRPKPAFLSSCPSVWKSSHYCCVHRTQSENECGEPWNWPHYLSLGTPHPANRSLLHLLPDNTTLSLEMLAWNHNISQKSKIKKNSTELNVQLPNVPINSNDILPHKYNLATSILKLVIIGHSNMICWTSVVS